METPGQRLGGNFLLPTEKTPTEKNLTDHLGHRQIVPEFSHRLALC
jgi:hypothetical protein